MAVRKLLLVSALSLSACGWLIGEAAEQKSRQDALEKVVYDDLDPLWEEAVKLWDEYGCTLPEDSKPDETFSCDKSGKRWLRVKSGSGGYRVEIEEERTHTQTDAKGVATTKTVRSRDWDMEFKLLERVEPEQAAAIEEAAEKKGDKAKDATRNLIDAFE